MLFTLSLSVLLYSTCVTVVFRDVSKKQLLYITICCIHQYVTLLDVMLMILTNMLQMTMIPRTRGECVISECVIILTSGGGSGQTKQVFSG